MRSSILTLILFVVFSSTSFAKTFRSSYVSFDLPDGWICVLEETEHVCSNSRKTGKQDAVFVLTAKERGPSDTLSAYLAHLRSPRLLPGRDGRPQKSKVKWAGKKQINNHEWIDGFHEGSELPDYFTRYMATTKDKLGILVTFSAHKRSYSLYSKDLIRAIRSLRVLSTSHLGNTFSGGGGNNSGPGGHPVFGGTGGAGMALPPDPAPVVQISDGGIPKNVLLGLALLLIIVGIYIFIKRKK